MTSAVPIIGYDNVFERGVVSVTHENPDFPKENALDWLTYSCYKTNTSIATVQYSVHTGYGETCNYVAIAGHNLGTKNASVVFQFNSGSGWVNAHTTVVPSDDDVIFITFPAVTAEDFRLSIGSVDADTCIGILSAGSRLTIPRGVKVGWAPPLINAYETKGVFAETNVSLGRSLKNRFQEVDLYFTGFTEDFVRTSYIPFLEHAKRRPFFFMWDSVEFTDEVALMHTSEIITSPNYVSRRHMQHSMKVMVEK